jgi:hypothetical protein
MSIYLWIYYGACLLIELLIRSVVLMKLTLMNELEKAYELALYLSLRKSK